MALNTGRNHRQDIAHAHTNIHKITHNIHTTYTQHTHNIHPTYKDGEGEDWDGSCTEKGDGECIGTSIIYITHIIQYHKGDFVGKGSSPNITLDDSTVEFFTQEHIHIQIYHLLLVVRVHSTTPLSSHSGDRHYVV